MVELEINEEITEIPLSKVSFMVQLEINDESTEMQMLIYIQVFSAALTHVL